MRGTGLGSCTDVIRADAASPYADACPKHLLEGSNGCARRICANDSTALAKVKKGMHFVMGGLRLAWGTTGRP